MEFLYQYIKNICIFSLVISIILNIFPESSSKKYIKLFSGVVLLVLIMNPIIKIKNNGTDIEKIIKNYTHGSPKLESNLKNKKQWFYTNTNARENLESKMYERVNNEYKENQ